MFYKYFNIRMCTKMNKVANKYNANYFYKKGNSPKVNHHQMDQSMDVDGADRLIMDTE